jgi:phage N-6-adenine-methyltransferase
MPLAVAANAGAIVIVTSLTVVESQELACHEAVIARGLKTFVEVGEALRAIRDDRLYRQGYATFEDYCRERWGINRSYSYELIEAAQVAVNVRNSGHELTAVSQARPLASLDPDQQRDVWRTAVESAPNGRLTAAHVERTKQRVIYDDFDDGWGDYEDEPAIEKERPPATPDRMTVHYSSSSDEWETPEDIFDALNREFDFTLDVCAQQHNAKCLRFFSPEDDGLKQDWNRRGAVCWMNPPYGGEIGKWVKKAWDTAMSGNTVVCLLPARVDTAWWWDYCRYGEVRFLRGRLRFGGGENSAPFPSAIVIFRPQVEPVVRWWDGWRGTVVPRQGDAER